LRTATQRYCCADLFASYSFEDLRSVEPPNKKGVYIVRVTQAGKDAKTIVKQVEQEVEKLKWRLVKDYVLSRTDRLNKIAKCPVIYIGSAGTRKKSKNTLQGRYKELASRHTAMLPIWALIYSGWKLDYGWKEEEDPLKAESLLKQEYKKKHEGRLPALVDR